MGTNLIILFICTALILTDTWFILNKSVLNMPIHGEASLPSCFQSDRFSWRQGFDSPHWRVCVCMCMFTSLWICVFLFVYVPLTCLHKLIFPIKVPSPSCLLYMCVERTLFTSGTLHHYFPILHVTCWVSSCCQLPAEWCFPLYLKSFIAIAG